MTDVAGSEQVAVNAGEATQANTPAPAAPEVKPLGAVNVPESFEDKFKSADGGLDAGKLYESYRASQAELTRRSQQDKQKKDSSPKQESITDLNITPDAEPEPDTEAQPSLKNSGSIAEFLTAKGVDVNAALADFAKTGSIPEDAVSSLEDQGMSRSAAVETLKGIANTYVSAVSEGTRKIAAIIAPDEQDGGKVMEKAKELVDWGKKYNGIKPAERESLNAQLSNIETAHLAIRTLEAYRLDAAKAAGDKPLESGDSASSPNTGFKSKAEMHAAMNDNRWRFDANYKAEVRAKMAKTDPKLMGF